MEQGQPNTQVNHSKIWTRTGPGSRLGIFLVCSSFACSPSLLTTTLPWLPSTARTSASMDSGARGPGGGSLTRPYSHQQKSTFSFFFEVGINPENWKTDIQIFLCWQFSNSKLLETG